MRLTEAPRTFVDSLPPRLRGACWLATAQVTLTLPDLHGRYTSFTVRRCLTTQAEA